LILTGINASYIEFRYQDYHRFSLSVYLFKFGPWDLLTSVVRLTTLHCSPPNPICNKDMKSPLRNYYCIEALSHKIKVSRLHIGNI
jgi:hypothetical protein